jgi:hypothetical protein
MGGSGKGEAVMLRLARGKVARVLEEDAGMQVLEVELFDGSRQAKREQALSFLQGTGTWMPGDPVLLNTTAVRLGLGTGGYHIVVARLEEQGETDVQPSEWGHIMKMRYSPMQLAVDAIEEQNSRHHALFTQKGLSLEAAPVLIGELHSLLPTLTLALKRMQPSFRLVYLMPDAASLPIGLSKHVRQLKQAGQLAATVTAGHAWGGDLETVNIHTGLLAARHVAKADIIVCLLGPGVVGTGTELGFSAMQLAEVIHAVSLLDGLPIFIPRISFADLRPRHQGVSHHTRTLLKRFTLRPVLLPVPLFADWRDLALLAQEEEDQLASVHHRLLLDAPEISRVAAVHAGYPGSVKTMGRSLADDPSPFQTAYLAAQVAVRSSIWIKGRGASLPGCGDPAILAALCSYLTSCEA